MNKARGHEVGRLETALSPRCQFCGLVLSSHRREPVGVSVVNGESVQGTTYICPRPRHDR